MDYNNAVSNGDTKALIDLAIEGHADACKTLSKWYKNGTNGEVNNVVSITFGLFYIAFYNGRLLDDMFVKDVVNQISECPGSQLKVIYNWIKEAEFPSEVMVYKDLLELAKCVKNHEEPAHESLKHIYDLKDKNVLVKYTTPAYGKILSELEAYRARSEADKNYLKAIDMGRYADNRDYKEVISLLIKSVEAGHSKAKGEIGRLYFFGIENEKHSKDPLMIKYLKESFADGDMGAAFFLFECYLKGIGIEKNKKTAFKYLLIANGINAQDERHDLVEKEQYSELLKSIESDRNLDYLRRNDILAVMYYYGFGTTVNKTTAVKYKFDSLSSPDKQIFANKIPEQYGTEKRSSEYEICEEVLLAGIELERNGRDYKNSEEEREISLAMAKKYYIAALEECPRAAVYLLRFMMESRDADFLPFAAFITTFWVGNCDDSRKAINMAYYLMGLYYEYYYTEFADKTKYSDFILKSNLDVNRSWIEKFRTSEQDIFKAKTCYSKAMMIDDAARRFGMLLDFR